MPTSYHDSIILIDPPKHYVIDTLTCTSYRFRSKHFHSSLTSYNHHFIYPPICHQSLNTLLRTVPYRTVAVAGPEPTTLRIPCSVQCTNSSPRAQVNKTYTHIKRLDLFHSPPQSLFTPPFGHTQPQSQPYAATTTRKPAWTVLAISSFLCCSNDRTYAVWFH
jgi:hypothetical protein